MSSPEAHTSTVPTHSEQQTTLTTEPMDRIKLAAEKMGSKTSNQTVQPAGKRPSRSLHRKPSKLIEKRWAGKVVSDNDLWVERSYVSHQGQTVYYYCSMEGGDCQTIEPPTGASTTVHLEELEDAPPEVKAFYPKAKLNLPKCDKRLNGYKDQKGTRSTSASRGLGVNRSGSGRDDSRRSDMSRSRRQHVADKNSRSNGPNEIISPK